jgi:hypothetical protein
VTVTFLPLCTAVPEIVNVAVTVVAFTGVTLLTVIPTAPPGRVTFTAVAPVKLVPVRVTVKPTPPRV